MTEDTEDTINQGPASPESPDKNESGAESVLNKVIWHQKVDDLVAESHYLNGEPVSVLLMDIDSFKGVNDSLGHQEGDNVIEALRDILALVVNNLRTEDTDDGHGSRGKDTVGVNNATTRPDRPIEAKAGRFGGDEFGILVKTSIEGAKLIAERVRKKFLEYLDMPENKPLKELGLDISIGVATLRFEDTASDLLKRADDGLYEEKMLHLPELTEEQREDLLKIKATLEKYGIRPRDLPKHLGRIALGIKENESYKAS